MDDEEYSVAPSSHAFQAGCGEDGHQGKCYYSNDDHEMSETSGKNSGLNEEVQVPSSVVKEKEVDDSSRDPVPWIKLLMRG